MRSYDSSNKLNDISQVYCDDGKGFREGLKDKIAIQSSLNNQLTIRLDKKCKALRLVMLRDYLFPNHKTMLFSLKGLELETATKQLSLDDLKIVDLFDIEQLSKDNFKLMNKSAFLDLTIANTPIALQTIKVKIDFLEVAKR